MTWQVALYEALWRNCPQYVHIDVDSVLIHSTVDKLWTYNIHIFVRFTSTLCGPYVNIFLHIFVDIVAHFVDK